MNRLECEIIAWKDITNPVIDSQANTIPGMRANLLVRLVNTPVNLPVKLTKLGQGGAGPWAPGTTCRFLVPCGLAPGLPAPGTTCRVAPRQLIWGLAQGPRAQGPTYS